MPIPVHNIPFPSNTYQIECYIQPDKNGTKADSTLIFGTETSINQSATVFNYEQFNDNKKFLKLQSKLRLQIKAKKDYYKDIAIQTIENEFASCTNDLLEIKPDLISVELTSEKSLFYIIKKNTYTLFFQYFLSENKLNEYEEALLSVFHNDSKLPSFEGDKRMVVSYAKDLVSL